MLIFWSLVRNSVVLAVYLLFSVACFLTVHEHCFKDYNVNIFKRDSNEGKVYEEIHSDNRREVAVDAGILICAARNGFPRTWSRSR